MESQSFDYWVPQDVYTPGSTHVDIPLDYSQYLAREVQTTVSLPAWLEWLNKSDTD